MAHLLLPMCFFPPFKVLKDTLIHSIPLNATTAPGAYLPQMATDSQIVYILVLKI